HAVPAGSGRSICGNSEALLPREETTLRDLRHQGLGDTALHKKKPRSRERGWLLPKASVSTATPSTCRPCRARRERPEHLRQQRSVVAARRNDPPGSPPPRPSVIPRCTGKSPARESGACFCRRRLSRRQLLVHVAHAVPAGSGRSICGNIEALLARDATTLLDLRHQGLR